jgi:hypothetical protein
MKIHAITKTYKLFFRHAPYKKELLASLLDLATTSFKENAPEKINCKNALTLGILGLICISAVKKKLITKSTPCFNQNLTKKFLMS